MLPFSLQVTRYLICASIRVDCSVGLSDAYNAMYATCVDLWASMSPIEKDQSRMAWDLFMTLNNFAGKARYGVL